MSSLSTFADYASGFSVSPLPGGLLGNSIKSTRTVTAKCVRLGGETAAGGGGVAPCGAVPCFSAAGGGSPTTCTLRTAKNQSDFVRLLRKSRSASGEQWN